MGYIHVENIKRVRAYLETAIGTDYTGAGTIASFVDLPVIEGAGSLDLNYETQDPLVIRQNRDDHNLEELMFKRATYNFTIPLATADARAGDGTAATQTALGYLLEMVLGGQARGTGDTVDSASSATSWDVTTAARWQAGDCVGWVHSDGFLYLREVESMSSATMTVKSAMPGSPQGTDVLYNADSYYMHNLTSSDSKSIQMVVEGYGLSGAFEDCWVLLGGHVLTPPTFELANGEIPTMSFTIEFANWLHSDDADYTPAALSPITYSDNNIAKMVDSNFYYRADGTTTMTALNVQNYGYTLNWKYTPITSPGGVNNIAAYVPDGEHPKVSGMFALPYEDQTYLDGRDARTAYNAMLQIGRSATNGAILISAPTTQITSVQRRDINGIMGQEIEWVGRLDEETSEASSTVQGLAPFRIHFA